MIGWRRNKISNLTKILSVLVGPLADKLTKVGDTSNLLYEKKTKEKLKLDWIEIFSRKRTEKRRQTQAKKIMKENRKSQK